MKTVSGGDMPAFMTAPSCSHQLKELQPGRASHFADNGSINFIFMSDGGLPGASRVLVLDRDTKEMAFNLSG